MSPSRVAGDLGSIIRGHMDRASPADRVQMSRLLAVNDELNLDPQRSVDINEERRLTAISEDALGRMTPAAATALRFDMRVALDRLDRELSARKAAKSDEIVRLEAELAWREKGQAAYEQIVAAATPPLRLGRTDGSAWHKLADAYQNDSLIAFTNGPPPKDVTFGFADVKPQIFVVQHDWAAAFAGAGEFDDGAEYALPYPRTVFEMTINGRRFIADLTSADNLMALHAMVDGEMAIVDVYARTPGARAKMTPPTVQARSALFLGLVDFIEAQIKAICVALDAEIAVADVVRSPAKLNAARAKRGARPLNDYHVVNLARRTRAAPLPPEDRTETGRRLRLHFRRGHWRHYENHRTWIRWTLVGDPDLGFIDKEYRA